jgi:hypothetical protein
METPARYLLFHGAIVFLIGLLCGMPYGIAIHLKQNDEVIRAWRLAHGALSLSGTAMIAIAAILSSPYTTEMIQWSLAIALIVSGYGFSFALTLEPFVGERGLLWTKSWSNNIVFVGNGIGILGSLIGSVVMVYAAYMSLE